MAALLLGFVERFGLGKTGPGARLRPAFQASSDKSRWVVTEEEFLNSGVVSWWQPLPDAERYKAWTFYYERSPKYEVSNEQHDLFRVKGVPNPPVELIDLPRADDPEDVRSLLLEEGIPFARCASKRCAFRDRSGSIMGPFDLILRDARLFLAEKDSYVTLSRGSDDLVLGEWEGHAFLPIENGIIKTGDVDFSPNSVFIGRVLKDLRDMPPNVRDDAKLTDKLIRSYVTAYDKSSLTSLQRQRLKRLHRLAENASIGIDLEEGAVKDLLSLPGVTAVINQAKEDAARKAVEDQRAILDKLEKQRHEVEAEVGSLRDQATELRGDIASAKKEQAEVLSSFDGKIQGKFEEIGKNATSFLAEIAVIRAAISTPTPTSTTTAAERAAKVPMVEFPHAEPLDVTRLVSTVRERFEGGRLGSVVPAEMLSSWASGYVPMLFGVMARDALLAAANCLSGGNIHFASLGPTVASPGDIRGSATVSPFAVSTVGELMEESALSGDLVILVFENANLCQTDSALVPVLRSYAEFHGGRPASGSASYPTLAGMWPPNVLVAGTLTDSQLAIPLCRDLWAYATFIDATKSVAGKPKAGDKKRAETIHRLRYEEWVEWHKTIPNIAASDTGLIAKDVSREVDSSSLFKRMLSRLSAAIDETAAETNDKGRAGMIVETAVLPYLLSRGVPHEELFEQLPDISTDDAFVEKITRLFEKWGIEAAQEP